MNLESWIVSAIVVSLVFSFMRQETINESIVRMLFVVAVNVIAYLVLTR